MLRIKIWLLPALMCALAMLPGCSSHNAAENPPQNSKRIVDLVIDENPTALVLTIKGNLPLAYKAGRPEGSGGILMQFPDTAIALERDRFHPPDNEFISIIQTRETAESAATAASIFIGLKTQTHYEMVPVEAGLQIVFTKSQAPSQTDEPKEATVDTNGRPESVQKNAALATVLKSVTSRSLADSFVVDIEADGTIKNYKTFTLKNPARIVFDFYRLRSPFKNEQMLDIQSKWVRRIRYFGHPDKLRLVLETSDALLRNYTYRPTQTGLIIRIGDISADDSQSSNMQN
jgi:hypothetical protein